MRSRPCEQRRSGERHSLGASATTVGLSRRESLALLGGVVSDVTNIKSCWCTPPLPQRQDVVFSGGTDHLGRASSVKWAFDVPQPTVTVVRAKAWV